MSSSPFYIAFLLGLIFCFVIADNGDDLEIETTNGWIQGHRGTVPSLNEEVDTWNAIPYAEPPVDNLRFRHPQLIAKWEGVKDVRPPAKHCPQISKTFLPVYHVSEDCLYLSVVVPANARRNQKKLPVMVWFSGGGSSWTTSRHGGSLDFSTLAVGGQVIVVSIQYRMGSLGFLYFDTKEYPGNAGIFDQVMALKFIKDNIARFSGDPESITLFGEGHGADSIALHLFGRFSGRFFNRAILQAGSASGDWEITEDEVALQRTIGLAKKLNCARDGDILSVTQIVECMRTKPWPSLVTTEFGSKGYPAFPFMPVVDGVFLTEMPNVSLEKGKFKQMTLIIGGIQDGYDTNVNGSITAKAENDDERKKSICDLKEIAHWYAKWGNHVYMYYFAEKFSRGINAQRKMDFLPDDLPYILGEPLHPTDHEPSGEEVELSRLMMTCWGNFAKTGNPNLSKNGSWNALYWPMHTFYGQEYLELNLNSTKVSSIGHGTKLNKCNFSGEHLAYEYSTDEQSETIKTIPVHEVSIVGIVSVVAVIILVLVPGIFIYYRRRRSGPHDPLVESSL